MDFNERAESLGKSASNRVCAKGKDGWMHHENYSMKKLSDWRSIKASDAFQLPL